MNEAVGTANVNEGVNTYYGSFSSTIRLACEGRENLAGDWIFAKGLGLVRIDAAGARLNLVAPF